MQVPDELEELRIDLERMRTLLENLVVRGLRACGDDELSQIRAFSEHLERSGAGHLASVLSELRGQIERDERQRANPIGSADERAPVGEIAYTTRREGAIRRGTGGDGRWPVVCRSRY